MHARRSSIGSGHAGRARAQATTNMLLVADTHLGPGQTDRLLARIADEVAAADVIVHAGDVIDASVLEVLASHVLPGRFFAVKGNNDHGLDLPQRLCVDVDGCALAVVHDSGAAAGRAARLQRWFPSADLVVFGHSHLPWHEVHVGVDGRVQHQVNPGSPTLRRRAPTCTVAHVVIEHGHVTHVRHAPVGSFRAEAQADAVVRRGLGRGSAS